MVYIEALLPMLVVVLLHIIVDFDEELIFGVD